MTKNKTAAFSNVKEYYGKNRYFIKIFLTVVGMVIVIMTGFTLVLVNNSIQIMNREINLTNYAIGQRVQSISDTLFKRTQVIGSTLLQDTPIMNYLYAENPFLISSPLQTDISRKLLMYYNAYDYLDSIYLYSETSQTVWCGGRYVPGNGCYNIASFPDQNWVMHTQGYNTYTSIIPRMRNDYYPYFLSVYCHPSPTGHTSCILNINVEKLRSTIDNIGGSIQSTYIVSGSDVLYGKNMTQIPESLSVSPALQWLLDFPDDSYGIYSYQDRFYAVARVPSSTYDWDYVSVTDLQNYHQQIMNSQSFILLIMCVIAFFVIGVVFFISSNIYKPIRSLQRILDDPKSLMGRDVRAVQIVAEKIVTTINTNTMLQTELNQRIDLLQRLQISALQIQINPHFLFNVLNIINLTIVNDYGLDQRSSDMICDLSELLHFGLDGSNKVNLQTEIYFSKKYISLMQKRYTDLFTVSWKIQPEILDCDFPKLSLQPILENAIYYGCSPLDGIRHTSIIVEGENLQESVRITITDDGIGMDPEQLETVRERLLSDPLLTSKHIGLRNVNHRIRLMYGSEYGMEINSEKDKGTSITIHVPYIMNADPHSL